MTPKVILDGSKSMAFISDAQDELPPIMPNARRQTLTGQAHNPAPEPVAPILAAFLAA